MTIEEFEEQFKNFKSKDRIFICCDICKCKKNRMKENIQRVIKKYGYWICRSCIIKRSHAENPVTEATKEKQRLGRLGKKHSEDSKKRMSKSKSEFYKTPEGNYVISSEGTCLPGVYHDIRTANYDFRFSDNELHDLHQGKNKTTKVINYSDLENINIK